MARERSGKRRKGGERVDATCARCGLTRQVRAKLVAGCDLLLCASHDSVTGAGIAVPEGHRAVWLGHVAGYFAGYRIEKATPEDQLAVWRAQTIAAAAQGRPAPPRPQVEPEPVDARLVEAITGAVGDDGWEIADWVREGREFEVKVYTDWGWAGFLAGTARQIASDLKALQDQAAVDADKWRCPHCDAALDPRTGPTQCGCGTVAWTPRAWRSPFDAAFDALTYVDDVPDRAAAEELMLLAVLLDGSDDEWRCEDDLHTVMRALSATVPTARWSSSFDHPVGIIPTGATFEAPVASAVLAAANTVGYQLRAHRSREWGRTQIAAWFELEGGASGLPPQFSLVRCDDGSWQVLVTGEPWWPPEDSGAPDDALDCFEEPHFELDGWPVLRGGWMDWRDGLVTGRSVRFDPTDPEQLADTLRGAHAALAAASDRFDSAFRELHAQTERS